MHTDSYLAWNPYLATRKGIRKICYDRCFVVKLNPPTFRDAEEASHPGTQKDDGVVRPTDISPAA